MDRNFRKYTKKRLNEDYNSNYNYKSKRRILPGFIGFVFYSVLSAIIFLLVYSFFFAPELTINAWETTKEKIENIGDKISESNPFTGNSVKESNINKIRLVPSEMEEYGFWMDSYKSCAYLESLGDAEGVYNIKQKSCREACGKRDMDYGSNNCKKDLLVCYCKG